MLDIWCTGIIAAIVFGVIMFSQHLDSPKNGISRRRREWIEDQEALKRQRELEESLDREVLK